MATETLNLNVKTGTKDNKNYWDKCGVAFVNKDDDGNITSISVKLNMFPNLDIAAFPPKAKDEVME